MNYIKISPLLTCALALPLFAMAQTTWTGGVDNDFANAANWDNGAPNNSGNTGFITSGTPVYDETVYGNLSSTNVDQSGGTTSIYTDNQVTVQNDSTWNMNGGTLDISGVGRLSLGSGSTINMNGGNLTSTGGGVMWINTSDASLNILQDLTTDVTISQRTGNVTVDNSTFTVSTFNYANNTSLAALTLQNGATFIATTIFDYAGGNNTNQGQISFSNGVNSLQAAAWDKPAEMQFDFSSSSVGSTITITAGFYDQAGWEQKWADGELTLDGGNAGSFSDYFTVSGDTLTLSTVPEPSAYAMLLALGVLGFVMHRRRR